MLINFEGSWLWYENGIHWLDRPEAVAHFAAIMGRESTQAGLRAVMDHLAPAIRAMPPAAILALRDAASAMMDTVARSPSS